ncbi:MAG: DUF3180 family protein [Actinobacteria bacterium]|uniref:Unannotated protein n=1 Tax=freshwater metagenome TaxID=449393 RepID=A0A6J7FNX5_9ZZZZ|nr:DUF3180 family protein [Actinomycetota bacterium]
MKRTSASLVAILLVVSAVSAYLIELALVANGGHSFAPPLSLPITLVAIAVAVVGLAIPVRRAVMGKKKRRLDPFYSVRVAVLAKASSLTGALLAGLGVGIVIHTTTLPIVNGDLFARAIAQAVGAAILLTAGLIAEHMCTIPPDKTKPSDSDVPPEPLSGGSHV